MPLDLEALPVPVALNLIKTYQAQDTPLFTDEKTYKIKGKYLRAYARDGFACALCGAPVIEVREKKATGNKAFFKGRQVIYLTFFTEKGQLTPDHILPKSLGGDDTTENVRPMCEPCNNNLGTDVAVEKIVDGSKLTGYLDAGFWVRPWSTCNTVAYAKKGKNIIRTSKQHEKVVDRKGMKKLRKHNQFVIYTVIGEVPDVD